MKDASAHWIESAYGLEAVRCTEVFTRPRNTLVRVEARQGAFWLRAATGESAPVEAVEAEAELVTALAECGVRVAVPRAFDGRFARVCSVFHPPSTVLLLREAAGIHVTMPDAAQAEALGGVVASIQTAAPPAKCLPYAHRIDRAYLADNPIDRVEPWLRAHHLDPEPLRAMADEMSARVDWDESVLCHGDLHAENARFNHTEPTLFDFEAWGLGPPAYDLASFWRKHVHRNDDPERAATVWSAFLRGYGRERTLRDASIRSIPALATLRAIWVMALPTAPGARWGRGWLEECEYFTAHLDAIADFARAGRS